MGRIHLLPPDVANKIAAGEVVERPASVVKELVENALDAGARNIDISLVDAGKTMVRVADDGGGIGRDDLPLAFAPHATSKIGSADDLFHVETNGFRGEALASIQSVARVRLISRTPDDAHAWEVQASGGDISALRETSGALGTVVEVRDLFFNIPARRKWLRSDQTEFSHALEIVQAIAGANPETGFRVRHGERLALDVPEGQAHGERVQALYGHLFREGLLEVHDFEPYARLDAFLAPPSTHRPNSRGLLLFVNRRPIRDRSLMQAVILAYREFLPPGRYPAACLFLSVNSSDIDVNVHPAKVEVRFLEQSRIFSLIKAAVTERLISSGLLPKLSTGALSRTAGPLGPQAHGPQARPDSPYEPDYDLRERQAERALFADDQLARARAAEHRWQEARQVLERGDLAALDAVETVAAKAPQGPAAGREAAQPETPAATPSKNLLQRARGLFQIGNAYLVVETEEGAVIIDQHAYHERILYWLLEQRFQERPVERQRLLTPLPLDLSPGARELAREHEAALKAFGFELVPFGPDGALALSAVPRYGVGARHLEVVQSICEDLAEGRKPSGASEVRKALLETVACHASVRAGDPLTPEQIRDLLKLGETVPHTFACPHGRPTSWLLSFRDLEKLFHRR